jgi:hypothetical protein
MAGQASELARRLAREAEAVCRAYLANGRRHGGYWTVGDIHNTPGRSLYVRLKGGESGPGAAGKWTDASTGEHGDLLDLIARARNLDHLGDVLDEARIFLSLPRPEWISPSPIPPAPPASAGAGLGSPEAARRLFRAGRSLIGTPAESYLRARGITASLRWPSLRYHPSVYYRAFEDAPREVWPALLAAVTDHEGRITGLHRTWLDPTRSSKAPLADPRKALGHLLGNGVRFGVARDVVAAGEGIETILALKSILPTLPMIAALSANHLAALDLPPNLRRLYVALDNDEAGRLAAVRLRDRTAAAELEMFELRPVLADFNVDLCQLGAATLLRHLVPQLVPADQVRFAPDVAEADAPEARS